MGLDMYLNAKIFTSSYINSDLHEKVVKHIPVPSETVELSFQVGYWRKANQIHAWFVNNVQNGEDDCEEYHVTRDQLHLLKNDCLSVLENPSLGPKVLPTQEGFFFGSTEYNEYYLRDLRHTIKIIDGCFSPKLDDCEFFYRASW